MKLTRQMKTLLQCAVLTTMVMTSRTSESVDASNPVAASEDTNVAEKDESSETCEDRHSCAELELNGWIAQLKDQKSTLEDCSKNKDIEDLGADDSGSGEPIFTFAKNCNEDGAVWGYKYSGGKGRGRIFKGKGKLLFSKLNTPPHGYDYGLKSGRCLKVASDEISGLEGSFNKEGMLDGEGQVSFFDGKVSKGTFRNGVLHGLVRQYEVQYDKHTNLELPEKRLYSLATFKAGKQYGSKWIIKKDGINLFGPLDGSFDGLSLAILPPTGTNTSAKARYLLGSVEEDNMLLAARDVRLAGVVDGLNCLKVPTIEVINQDRTFDYDLEIRAETRATTAKLLRFFDTVTDEKNSIDSQFKPDPFEINNDNAVKVIDVKNYDGKYFHVTLLGSSTVSLALKEGGRIGTDKQTLEGITVFKIVSSWKRKDLLSLVNAKQAEEDESKRAEEKANLGDDDWTDDEGFDDVRKTEEYNTESKDSADNSTETTLNDEAFLEELVTYDELPFNSKRYAKELFSIRGSFVKGNLQGRVQLYYGDSSVVEGLAVDSCLHGLVRRLAPPFKQGRRKRYIGRHVENVVITASLLTRDDPIREVTDVASFIGGRQQGPAFRFLIGGTILFGDLYSSNLSTGEPLGERSFTTDSGAYINQDLETCYVGQLTAGKMINARMAIIEGHKDMPNGVRVPVISEPADDQTVYRFLEQHKGEMVDPLVTDPTEDSWVEVKSSEAVPGQDGLFSRREILRDTVVAFFGGMRVNQSEWNVTRPLDPDYWIKAGDGTTIIYLPQEIGRSTSRYRATLGHKINHSFSAWNCLFHSLDHPRFGLIPAARTTERVPAGKELLCLYELDYHEGAPWFQELWRKDIDDDSVYGPVGHRGPKKNASEPIEPMLDNATLVRDFYKYAVEELKLEPFT